MKVNVYDLSGKPTKEISLPKQFDTPVRKDLIRRAVSAAWKNRVQPYGHKKHAGRESSGKFRSTRTGYGHSYNWGIARLPRLMVRGGRRVGRVINVPQAVGGPRVHGPTPVRNWNVKMNDKERRLAIRSALAATLDVNIVMARGHMVKDTFPLFVVGTVEALTKTKEVLELFLKFGLADELGRASKKKIRAGKGKSRGRPYKKAKGPLLVVSEICPLIKAASNIPGVDVVVVNQLNTELLAPGAHPGRLTVFTEKAIEKMETTKLFL
ncbi:MAG: 50S ribosomal protein L4 [Candidatus Altiarchaeota archaeon]|nr:50S ribosomal protein L4 [Candidatus Altiarchaeota archaeon]